MADAIIDIIGPEDVAEIVRLYNQIFRPSRDVEFFNRRYLGRHNVLQMVARIEDRPVGFFLGFELKPSVYFAWFYGVVSDCRRKGIASQLMEAVHDWARNTTTRRCLGDEQHAVEPGEVNARLQLEPKEEADRPLLNASHHLQHVWRPR